MAKRPVESQDTGWRISAEVMRLLERLAERAGTTLSAVCEQAIREKAGRENVTLDGEPYAGVGPQPAPPSVTPEQRAAALERFRALVEKARSHDTGERTPEEIEQEVGLAITEVHEIRRVGRR